jgi:hypothetical protein
MTVYGRIRDEVLLGILVAPHGPRNYEVFSRVQEFPLLCCPFWRVET